MKDYLNQNEQIKQLIITLCQTTAKDLIESNCINDKEKQILKKVVKYVSQFNESIFERLGESYKRALLHKSRDNKFIIASRYSKQDFDLEETIDNDILHEIIDSSANIECEGCKREDCLNCGYYKIKSYLRYEGKSEDNNLCPFRKEKREYDFNFEL